ncbi:unnamed protein product, partial [Ranitomeya imitator]
MILPDRTCLASVHAKSPRCNHTAQVAIYVDAYVDSGAALSLMDWSFANRCGFSLEPLEVPIPLKGIDSTPLAMNKPQYWTHVTMRMTPVHQEVIRFLNVVRLHGIPENIVSDRGSQFVSRFWQTFCAKMGIDLSFSSAFHPQTNGQTERTNQTLETYLRCFVSADQDDWVTFLPLAEFALNNRASSATLVSPFFCNSGFHPRFSSGQVEPSDCPGVDMVVDRLHQIWSHVVDNLKLSQERAQQFANRRRRVGPRLRVGDLVWLSSRFVPMKVSSPKFKPRFIGPYRILEILNPVSFRLDLPASFAIHNVFHRSLLRKYEVPVVPSLEPPAPVLVEGELDGLILLLMFHELAHEFRVMDDEDFQPLLDAPESPDLQQSRYLRHVQDRNLYLATFGAVLGPLSFGFVLGFSSPAISDLKNEEDPRLVLDKEAASWFGSIVTIGAAAGGILGGWMVDSVGRKLSLMLCALPFVLGFTLIISAQNVWMLLGGRVLSGLASGVTSLVVPVYISETSHSRVRGALGSCVQLMVVTGIVGAYIAGMMVGWRWLAVVCSIPPVFMLFVVCFMPETPRYLINQERRAEAMAALCFLRGPNVDHEWEYRQIMVSGGQQ